MNHLCTYCNKSLSVLIDNNDEIVDKYVCNSCPCRVVYFFLDEIHTRTQLLIKWKTVNIVVQYILCSPISYKNPRHFHAFSVSIADYHYPHASFNTIMQADIMPNITPYNFKEKLATIINFS